MPDDSDTTLLPRLLIADDDLESRARLATGLSRRFEIVGLAEDAEQAIALATSGHPEVALIDAHMPAGGGLRATREISRQCPGVAVCALSTDELEHEVLDILLAGAVAYVRKQQPLEHLGDILFECLRAHPALVA